MKDENIDTVKSTDVAEEDNPSVDRGWAWIVVLGALTINIIYDGCSYSFGIFFTKLLKYFGDTKSNTVWIGSLFFSVPLLCGPIASFLTSKFGYRKTTMIGGLIACIGISVGAFSNSIGLLCITYGLIGGFGMSLPYFNTIIVEAVYFKRRRAFATGIAESGAGVGTVIFAPLTNYLISVYGWRGAFLITGAIAANIVVCGALFRPIKSVTQIKGEAQSNINDNQQNNLTENDIKNKSDCVELHSINNKHSHVLGINEILVTNITSDLNYSVEEVLEQTDKNELQCVISAAEEHTIRDQFDVYTGYQLPSHSSNETDKQCGNADRTNIWHSTLELQEKTSNVNVSDKIKQNGNMCTHFVSKYLANTFILTNKGFVLFSLSNFIMYFWYDVPYVFLVDKAISMNISDTNATFLVSIIGIVHTVGNVCYGFLGDKQKINRSITYGISIMLCGASIIFVPSFASYTMLAVLAGLFGLFSAANEAMCSIILIDIVGIKNLNQAYGIIMMLQGIANLVGPPVAGKLLAYCLSLSLSVYLVRPPAIGNHLSSCSILRCLTLTVCLSICLTSPLSSSFCSFVSARVWFM